MNSLSYFLLTLTLYFWPGYCEQDLAVRIFFDFIEVEYTYGSDEPVAGSKSTTLTFDANYTSPFPVPIPDHYRGIAFNALEENPLPLNMTENNLAFSRLENEEDLDSIFKAQRNNVTAFIAGTMNFSIFESKNFTEIDFPVYILDEDFTDRFIDRINSMNLTKFNATDPPETIRKARIIITSERVKKNELTKSFILAKSIIFVIPIVSFGLSISAFFFVRHRRKRLQANQMTSPVDNNPLILNSSPLSHSTLAKENLIIYPTSSFNKLGFPLNQTLKCPVCISDFSPDSTVRILGCHHIFHQYCIDQWLTTNSSQCPLCKRDCRDDLNPECLPPSPHRSHRSHQSQRSHHSNQ